MVIERFGEDSSFFCQTETFLCASAKVWAGYTLAIFSFGNCGFAANILTDYFSSYRERTSVLLVLLFYCITLLQTPVM